VSADAEFAEDIGLWGANDPSDIETFQESGITLRETEPIWVYLEIEEDNEENVVNGEWVLAEREVEPDFEDEYDMEAETDFQNDFNLYGAGRLKERLHRVATVVPFSYLTDLSWSLQGQAGPDLKDG
jgi:hypothetical protein